MSAKCVIQTLKNAKSAIYIKREWLNRFVIKHINHAYNLAFEYIDTFYNTTRIHIHCNMQSPYDFRVNYTI